MHTYRHRGFTLIELMIVIVIISILSAIAYPSYRNTVLKSHRSEAKIALMEIANLQERFFMENNTYTNSLANNACGLGYGTLNSGTYYTENSYYTIGITNTTAPSLTVSGSSCTVSTATSNYTVTVTAGSQGGQTDDTDCNQFSINNLGNKAAKKSDTSTNNDCW